MENNVCSKEMDLSLTRFVKKWVKDEEVAKDIKQDTLLKYHTNQKQIKSNENAWLFTVARNQAIDYLKQQQKTNVACGENQKACSEPELNNFNEAVINCMLSLIPSMEEKYRGVLELSIYQNLSQKEISEQLDLSYTAVKSRMQRARQQLLQSFLGYCKIELDRFGNIIACEDRLPC